MEIRSEIHEHNEKKLRVCIHSLQKLKRENFKKPLQPIDVEIDDDPFDLKEQKSMISKDMMAFMKEVYRACRRL